MSQKWTWWIALSRLVTVVGAVSVLLGVVWWVVTPHGLHGAAARGQVDRVRELMDLGVDLDAPTRQFGDKWSRDMTPMMWAVEHDHPEVIRALAAGGARVDWDQFDNNSPLFWAIFWRHDDSLLALLDSGARTDVRCPANGAPPLHHAIMAKNADAVIVLLEHGADPAAIDSQGNRPLGMATGRFRSCDWVVVVKALIDAGVDPDEAVDTSGRTALMYAAMWREPELVSFLLDRGADAAASDTDGRRAVDFIEADDDSDAGSAIRRALTEARATDSGSGRTDVTATCGN